ncbi:probable arabinosyltransferase ARAD1 isoform X1 [Physcomitrium patens]|uniref:probable arabinosyltransferase ARAD1 isoform X1 n=1 Tax=Physcomitrium patens TaxID=3218 RepID=UPI003CCE4A3C
MSRKVSRLWAVLLFLVMAWSTWNATDYFPRNLHPTVNTPEISFLASLHGFLMKHAEISWKVSVDSPGIAVHGEGIDRSPGSIPTSPPTLNIYVYEMPAKFTTDLLWLFHNSLDQTVNLTSNGSPVHRLIQQHSVDFWLFSDLMTREDKRLLKTFRRVSHQEQADVYYVPFFTTIPFFLLSRVQSRTLYREAVKWITRQAAWQRSGGRDHVLAVHHPWSMKSHRRFLKSAIWLLSDLDSSGNWYHSFFSGEFFVEYNVTMYKEGEVSLEKDVIMPYVANVDACDDNCLATSKPSRKTLLFFQGRIVRGSAGKVRSRLAAVLRDEKERIVFQEGFSGAEGKATAQHGMRSSVFCLSPAGDTPSSARLFDAIVSGCIPVVVSDELELPFEGILDYRQVALFVPAARAAQKGWLVAHLRNKTPQDVAAMQQRLAQYGRHFRYGTPAQPLGPEDLTWRMVAGKLQSVRLHIRRSQRLVEGALGTCNCQCTRANSTATRL